MRFFHISDLHLGKRLNEYSLIEDQRYILSQIIEKVNIHKPDAVIIAGDIYDKSVPSAEAVALFDWFVTELSHLKTQVLAISGNHDSAERVAFGSGLMGASGVHFSPVYNGQVVKQILNDDLGQVIFYLLPFIRPSAVRRAWPEDAESISSYDTAARIAIKHMDIDKSCRNVLIAHQFVTGAEKCDSEDDVTVGGLDNIDADAFEDFDYVALGHIHSPQTVGGDNIRYCGSPLKYSMSEVNHKKAIPLITMGEKGHVETELIPLVPLRDLEVVKGSFDELCDPMKRTENYVHVVLTDEEEVLSAVSRLRAYYPNIMGLEYDNERTRSEKNTIGIEDAEHKSPLELFSEHFKNLNGIDMTEEQRGYMVQLIDDIMEEKEEK